MANGNNMLYIVLIIGAIALLFFGCKMGITQLCKLTGGKREDEGADVNSILTQLQDPSLDEGARQAIMNELDPYPRVTLTEAMEYIANSIVTDIDKGTFTQLGRSRMFELKADLFNNYKTDLSEIAEMNDVRLQPLEGRPLALYSRLLLEVCRRNGIALSPAVEASMRANLFAGTPTPGVVTANRSVIVA